MILHVDSCCEPISTLSYAELICDHLTLAQTFQSLLPACMQPSFLGPTTAVYLCLGLKPYSRNETSRLTMANATSLAGPPALEDSSGLTQEGSESKVKTAELRSAPAAEGKPRSGGRMWPMALAVGRAAVSLGL